MLTMYTVVAILGLTALLGVYLLSLVLRNVETPKGAAIIHGLFAMFALILLVFYSAGNEPAPWASVIILALAAMGGFILFFRDITGQKVPKWLGVLHGLLSITGLIVLLVFAFA